MKNSKLALTLLAVAVGLIGCGEEKKPAPKQEAKVEAPPPPSIDIKIGHVGYTTITEADFLREVILRQPDAQSFREEQLRSVGHRAITPDEARARLGL